MYAKFVDLEQAEQGSKNTATGLMRALMGLWYSRHRLAACSANSGINTTIRTSIFSKCMDAYLFVYVYALFDYDVHANVFVIHQRVRSHSLSRDEQGDNGFQAH